MRVRGFEIVEKYLDKEIRLPERKTLASAGYDIEAAEAVSLLPNKVGLIPTGLKAYMKADEYLGLNIRSGFSIRHAVSLINGQGIIDADYYNNPENEGHIMVAVYNHGEEMVIVEKGMRIAQGIFYRYLIVDGDSPDAGEMRRGGMGSTGIR